MRYPLIIAAALLGSANLFAATNTRFENFDADPGWDGRNNRATTPPLFQINQNFGWSGTTNNAGGGVPLGEIGGQIHGAAEPAYYAKVLSTPLTLNNSFNATGVLNVPQGPGDFLVGFFNNTTINEWRTPNTVALRIDNQGTTYEWSTEYATSRWRAGGALGTPPSSGTTDRLFSLSYDPTGNGGGGTVTGTIGSETLVVNLEPGHKAVDATFNRFGILNRMRHEDAAGFVWLDNININNTGVETFTTDPGWDSLRNRSSNGGSYITNNVRPRFNFGFSATNNAGGANSGEMGGLTWRGDSRLQFDGTRMAYYGDPLDATLDLNQPLVAAGKVSFNRGVTDATTMIGFFHSTDSNQNNDSQASGVPENFVGLSIEGPSREGHFFYPTYAVNQEASGRTRTLGAPYIYPNGDTHDWSLRYDPTANNGVGAVTVTLDGESVTLNLEAALRDIGAHFDRFGIITSHIDGNGQTVYFDDLTYTVGAAGPQWGVDGFGDWQVATNWLGGLPNGVNATATFGDLYLGSTGRTVFTHNPVTVGTLNFNRGSTYVLSGLGSLTMQVSSGSAVMNVQQGTHKINVPLTIASNTTLNVTPGATLRIADPVTVHAGRSLSQTGGGTVQFLSTINLLAGASVSFGSSQQLESLSIGANAVVDLTDAGLVMEGGSYGGLKELVKQGFNGGDWSGQGITSSTAQSDPRDATGVGIVDNGAVGHSQFAGISGLDGNEVLIGYTYYGDADLSGRIDLDDFQQFLTGYHGGPTAADASWLVGDFDYDSVVDLADFELLVRGLRHQPWPRLSPELLAAVTQFAHSEGIELDLSAVPEPSSVVALALGAACLLLRFRLRRVQFAVAVMAPVFAANIPVLAAVVPTIYDDFTNDSDAHWIGINNRSGNNNLGWSDTDNTGTSVDAPSEPATGAGELGGSLARGSGGEYAFDTGTIAGNDILHADGVYRYASGSGAWHIGWYNSDFHQQSGDPRNFVGLTFDDSRTIYSQVANNGDRQRGGAHTVVPLDGTTIQWTMNYNGAGTLSGVINGVAYTVSSSFTFMNGVTMDRFGIFTVDVNVHEGTFHFDDITFSSYNQIPPPPVGSLWKRDNDADWFVAGNWSGGVPNAVDGEATFGSIITGGTLVDVNSPVTLGKVHFSNANTYLLDGAGSLTLQVSSGSALIEVLQGTHKINLPLTIASDTELAVSPGATLKISDPITVAAGRNLTQSGTGSVNYESTISIGTGASMEFASSSHAARLSMATGSSMQLSSIASTALRVDALSIASGTQLALGNNELVVHGGAPLLEAFVSSGATFSGGGSLVVEENRTLELQDAADVDVVVKNQGRIELGFGSLAGQSEGLAFQQSATGALAIDLGGTGLNDFDRMTLTGAAQLGGVLDVALVGGFVPALGQTFNILSATGGVSGFFAQMNQPLGLPAGLLLDVVYSPTLVQLRVINDLAGDYNRNGVVDAADFVVWREKQGQAVTRFSSADGDGDGIVDSDDYTVWRSHFGQTASALAQSLQSSEAAVPEPGTWLLALGLVIGICSQLGRQDERRWRTTLSRFSSVGWEPQ